MLDTRLTIKHLQMVHAIDAAESMTKAAELLNISQPALSSRLHDAEELLGIRLFHRRGRRLSLSGAGQLLLRSSRTILSELTSVENELKTLPNQPTRALRVGMPHYASFAWLPAAVSLFEQEFPAVALEIVSAAATQPRNALIRSEVDFAIISSPTRSIQLDRNRFRSKRLIRDELLALLPAKHAKADQPFVVAEDFVDETYITNSAVPERNREYELFFQPNAVYPERVVQVGFTGAILELVAAGIGTTIITRWILDSDERFSDVVTKPLTKSGLFVNWFAVFPRKQDIEEEVDALCHVISKSGPHSLDD